MAADSDDFEVFFRATEPRLRRAFGAHVAPSRIGDAVSAALEFAWQNWDRVGQMEFPVAYLFRVGLSKSRRRKQGIVPAGPPTGTPDVEPELISAMKGLTRRQREAVWLVDACEWTPTEAAEALNLSLSSVRTHRTRGLERLRVHLGVKTDA